MNGVGSRPDQFRRGCEHGFFDAAQEDDLKAWVGASLPRATRQVGASIEQHFGLVYESRSGLIALLHRLGLAYHKPNVILRKLDEEKQKAFIASYEKLLNSLADNEAVLFADAVHPTHAARPVGCWAPKQDKLAIEQTSGRQRINIHGALDLATGQTRMIEVATVDAASTIRLLEAIEALYPMLALIHVFLDNARYHHAKLVQDWLSRPDCRIRLHFVPAYCPALCEIDRKPLRHSRDDRQRIRVCFRPEGTQLAQKNIHRDGRDVIEREQLLLEIACVASRIVQLAQTAAVDGDQRFAVAEDLRRLATIIADTATLVHDQPAATILAGVVEVHGERMPIGALGRRR